MQTVSALPTDFSGKNDCADLHVSPSGKFLYGSNRGHNSIVVFAIDEGTGKLEYLEHAGTQGKTPRNFTLDPTGRFLLVANQESDTVVTLRIDPGTGRLEPTGHVAVVPTPVCLKFLNIRSRSSTRPARSLVATIMFLVLMSTPIATASAACNCRRVGGRPPVDSPSNSSMRP